MKRLLSLSFSVMALAFSLWLMNRPKPVIGDFQLAELSWPAYCDFYENEAMQTDGRAIFASQSFLQGTASLIHIDETIQSFEGKSEVNDNGTIKWLLRGNDDYSVLFEMTNSSDVPEIQNYSGEINVSNRRNLSSVTKNIIGRCSA